MKKKKKSLRCSSSAICCKGQEVLLEAVDLHEETESVLVSVAWPPFNVSDEETEGSVLVFCG